jgi:hypothetical protein
MDRDDRERELIPVEHIPISERIPPIAGSLPKSQALLIFFALVSSILFALLLGWLFEFLSLRGVVNVFVSRLMLLGAWGTGVLIVCLWSWGTNIKAKIPTAIAGSVLLAALLLVLDAWAPKIPTPIPGPLEDPVVHIEPEHDIVWSTHPGQHLGIFTAQFHNTGVPVDVTEIDLKYFLAQKSGGIIIKRLPAVTDPHKGPVQHDTSLPIAIDFNPYMDDIAEVSANFRYGPSLPGVYITARYRRHSDGKDYEISKAYGLLWVPYGDTKKPKGVALFTEGTNMGIPSAAISNATTHTY